MTAKVELVVCLEPTDRLHRHICQLSLLIEAYLLAAHQTASKAGPAPAHMVFASRAIDMQISLPLGGHVAAAARGLYLDNIQFLITSGLEPPDEILAVYSATVALPVFGSIVGNQFLLFFQEHLGWLRSNYGHDYSKWPETINFARLIRNAVSHGGYVEITNKNSKPICWRGLTLSPADTGKHIIGSLLSVPDIMLLMIDTAELLDQAQAPSLIWEPGLSKPPSA
ncbi:MAG TPA: hypothetical protein PLR07_13765 [Promineifilum sp.]|nr:hypothetical protein [Promineifilum sp.]